MGWWEVVRALAAERGKGRCKVLHDALERMVHKCGSCNMLFQLVLFYLLWGELGGRSERFVNAEVDLGAWGRWLAEEGPWGLEL